MEFIRTIFTSFKFTVVFIIALCIGLILGRYSLPKVVLVDAKKIFGVSDNELISNWPVQNNKQMALFAKIGGFNIYAPWSGDNNGITVIKNNIWTQIYGHTIDIMHQNNIGHFYNVTEWDPDNKGIYDAILYNTIDTNGNINGMVIDLDRDGQPDILVKSTYDNKGKSIITEQYNWIGDKWYKREKVNGKSMVRDGNKLREVVKKGRQFVFVD